MKRLKTVAGVLAGNMLLALTVAAIVVPHNLVMGGATGIGLAIHHYLPAMNLSVIVFIINAILFVVGAFTLGKKFAVTTLLSTICYPIFLEIAQSIPGIESLTKNTLLATLYGGCILGIGIGLVIRMGASTGGSDIIALVINKYAHIPISVCMYAVDFVIIAFQIMFCSPEDLMYGILALVLTSMLLGKVTVLGQSQIQLLIISDKYQEIKEKLLTEMSVGATLMKIETGLEGIQQSAVLCVLQNRKLYAVNEMIQKVDEKAFITITHINEVKGRGFTLDRNYKMPEEGANYQQKNKSTQ